MSEVKRFPIGIDLGTVNSVIAVHRNNKTEIIPFQGKNVTPSCIFYNPDDDEVFIGEQDTNEVLRHPENAIYDSKRLIGRSYQDISIQNYQNKFLFKIEPTQSNGIQIPVQLNGQTVYKTPQEVSSEILKAFKKEASDYLGYEVTEAVITVPAYFTFAQRNATKQAANLAGLKVLMLMNEPTAAYLHYISEKCEPNALSLVFDLGGGTLDISIVRYAENSLKVIAVDGDTFLGGRNFDEAIFEHFVKEKNMTKMSSKQRRRLLKLSEKFKIDLSNRVKITKLLEYFEGNTNLELKLTREKLEEITETCFQKCLNILKRSIAKAGFKKEDIDKVILVGGSTKIPKIKEIVKEFFDGKTLSTDLNPDLAVASGAAVKASSIKGLSKQNFSIYDVTPFSLGVNTIFGAMTTIIKSNSIIPTKRSTRHVTVKNYQEEIVFQIYEGERAQSKLNNYLAKLAIKNLPRKPAGQVKVEVTFCLDQSGLLKVTAEELLTGSSTQCEVDIELHDLKNNNILATTNIIEEDAQFLEFVKIKKNIQKVCTNFICDKDDDIIDVAECKRLINRLKIIDFNERDALKNVIKSCTRNMSDETLIKQILDSVN